MTYYEFMDLEITTLRAEVKNANEKNGELVDECLKLETALKDKDAYIVEMQMKLESMAARNRELGRTIENRERLLGEKNERIRIQCEENADICRMNKELSQRLSSKALRPVAKF